MANLTERFYKLKTGIGGNREKKRYEESFGMPREEQAYITLPNSWHRRILSELEFVLRLSREMPALCDGPLEEALDFLLSTQAAEGVITRSDVLSAEKLLAPVAAQARSYSLILAGHAHIDMNWMWSWQETVAATLDTFRTMLAIMDEYPRFCFSQSQASVYKIVEDFDPDMMARIKERIAEGRWEVTASAWVEQDKNMPSTESMARHILYTKNYLQTKWGLDPAALELDFSPDTFGHSAHMPELLSHGGVKYYYHCRGTDSHETLYRWKAPSGKEVLIYREPYWYNSGITPHIGSGLVDLSRKCGGLKTGLIVYGVGDHGGGPTRRDLERAQEMMEWPIYPAIRFGTLREFFHLAESVREKLTVIDHELNFILTGCYTTQGRIKMGNRKTEAALGDAEALGGLAQGLVHAPYRAAQYERAWQNVLFTHFHDILTGSCVQDSREHAMGLFSEALAVANTNRANAMRAIASHIDTSAFLTDEDLSQTQAEGAGPGFGSETFSVPGGSMGTGTGGFSVQAMPRGAGLRRLFHVFNPSAHPRTAVTEITVWDWTGDLARLRFRDSQGQDVTHQLVDREYRNYWDHKYFRVLVETPLPALGYATFQLYEAPLDVYPFFYQPDCRVHKPQDDYVMDNGLVHAVFHRQTGELTSLVELASGREFIREGEPAGLLFVETEAKTSNAWNIGRYLTEKRLNRNIEARYERGTLRQSLTLTIPFANSSAKAVITLDKGDRHVQYQLEVDWHEIAKGADPVAMLAFVAPAGAPVSDFLYDVPGGSQKRPPLHQEVPGLTYGAALLGDKALAILSDCKYGYRGADDRVLLTLMHAANSPDPYPDRGIHKIRLAVAVSDACPKTLAETSFDFCHLPGYVVSGAHAGSLSMDWSLLELGDGTQAILSGIKNAEAGNGLIVRLLNTSGETTHAELRLAANIRSVTAVDVMEQPDSQDAEIPTVSADRHVAGLSLPPYAMRTVLLEIEDAALPQK